MPTPTGGTPVAPGAWNPGIESILPAAFRQLATVFRTENVSTPYSVARERSAFLGLPPHDLVAFRPERLMHHEVLIRVTMDLSVSMGETYADLGVNFRRIVTTILERYVAPHLIDIQRLYADLEVEAEARARRALDALFSAASPPLEPPKRRWRAMFAQTPAPVVADPRSAGERAIGHCAASGAAAGADPLDRSVDTAVRTIVSAIVSRHGRLVQDRALLAELATTLIMNDEGSRRIGVLLDPWFTEAVDRESSVRVAARAAPVVMTVKGASASGKSTMRPLQRSLAERIGMSWSTFAVITPDIWRKYLLDYDTLGAASGYAGTLTGHEVEIIDRKLDLSMERKFREGRMSNLLIDRFRFDSFASGSGAEAGSQLLTRFGDEVYLFFMITPPVDTVERAWTRGKMFGRYKAVDDLLAHNVEAYTGMPNVFFTFACKIDRRVRFEFLDNSVPLGEPPRTVAFGTNRSMVVLDPGRLLDIDRFRTINVDARRAEDIDLCAEALAPERNTAFIRQCGRRLQSIRFANPDTRRVYAHLQRGRPTETDAEEFKSAMTDPEIRAALTAIDPTCRTAVSLNGIDEVLSPDPHTIGRWKGRSP